MSNPVSAAATGLPSATIIEFPATPELKAVEPMSAPKKDACRRVLIATERLADESIRRLQAIGFRHLPAELRAIVNDTLDVFDRPVDLVVPNEDDVQIRIEAFLTLRTAMSAAGINEEAARG